MADTRVTVDLPVPSCALAIGAHPDDVEFGCGATFAKWAAAGCRIVHVICTDGSKGTWDPDLDLDALVALREEEQRAASRALGGDGTVEFLGRVDGELTSDLEARGLVAAAIRRHRPDVVLGHDPWKPYRLHPDHRHAGFLCVEGVVAARDPHFFPEQGLAPHRPSAILLFEADEVNHVESATGESLAARWAGLEAHASQYETTHFSGVSQEDPLAGFRRREREKLAADGAHAGLPLGEAFHRIDET